MRLSFVAVGVLACVISCVSAKNPGIWTDDQTSVVQPPGYVDTALSRRESAPSPTPTKQITNAERLRRHLPLLPPTRRTGALSPRASCVPLADGTGTIQVRRASNGNILGYIRKTFDSQGSYTFSSNILDALTVKLSSTSISSGAQEISAVGGPDGAHPLIGAVGGSAGYDFNPGQLGYRYAYLSGAGHTNANSPPSFTAGHSIQSLGYNGPAESTTWFVDCLTLDITAQWTNADGSQPPTSLFYDPPVDFVGLVGDFNQFVSTFPGEGAYLVTLHFIPAGI
ncbi:hypothetical protein DFP72DRAFT_906217 [Ephemerocybe angulata]|uniref:Uncharacterized protein n=1 Tax=Ephemerocybe angulata TaxID=980116 RepID=A0A8H6M4S0_9AGAR|nr:hypothetical protein DFP72DRAFT_906217 [Tulosesus angulatus]